jgi:hypothetical protein
MVVGHEGVWVVSGFLGKWERERERGRKVLQKRGKKPFSPAYSTSGEVEDVQCHPK